MMGREGSRDRIWECKAEDPTGYLSGHQPLMFCLDNFDRMSCERSKFLIRWSAVGPLDKARVPVFIDQSTDVNHRMIEWETPEDIHALGRNKETHGSSPISPGFSISGSGKGIRLKMAEMGAFTDRSRIRRQARSGFGIMMYRDSIDLRLTHLHTNFKPRKEVASVQRLIVGNE